MNNILEMTEKEKDLVRKVQAEGHTDLQITKTPYEFRVRFTYKGGRAIGSQAIVYNIELAWKAGVENIRRLEEALL